MDGYIWAKIWCLATIAGSFVVKSSKLVQTSIFVSAHHDVIRRDTLWAILSLTPFMKPRHVPNYCSGHWFLAVVVILNMPPVLTLIRVSSGRAWALWIVLLPFSKWYCNLSTELLLGNALRAVQYFVFQIAHNMRQVNTNKMILFLNRSFWSESKLK